MGENPVSIEELKQQEADEHFNPNTWKAKVRRKLRKANGNSFSDQLKKKFREQNLAKANA